MEALSKEGATPKWGCGLDQLERRNVFIGELSRVGIKKPDLIGKPSVRNDAAFLTTLVGVTSVIAVAAGSLPGDWVSGCLSHHCNRAAHHYPNLLQTGVMPGPSELTNLLLMRMLCTS